MTWTTSTNGTWSTSGYGYSLSTPLTTEPFLQGRGPVEASSCTELSVVGGYVFDVNGYYRELGVDPSATRKDLREAYYRLDGQSSVRLTYVLKQLLNPAVRKEYDACPLGVIYWDRYVQEMVERRAKIRASEEARRRHEQGLHVNEMVERELLKQAFRQQGIDIDFADENVDDTPERAIDPDPSAGQDDHRPAKVSFGYAYYLWRCRMTGREDLERLGEWQEHLVRALSTRGVKTKIAVGLHGGLVSPAVRARVGYREVFFLHHLEPPTARLAERLADEWITDSTTPSQREILL